MCDIGTIGKLAMGSDALGLGLSTLGAMSGSSANRSAYKADATTARMNAIMADRRAEDALERGKLEADRYRRDMRQTKGSARASMAASGVDLGYGTPLDIFAGLEAIEAEDMANIEYNAEMEAWDERMNALNYRNSAEMSRMQADAENPALAGFSTLLSGAGQVADSWYKYGRSGMTGGSSYGGKKSGRAKN